MLICPACHHQEYEGTLYCNECGARLNWEEKITLRTYQSVKMEEENLNMLSQGKTDSSPPSPAFFSLHLLEYNQVFHIEGDTEITIGRTSKGQPILPDIDLSSYDAFDLGVSRLHASLKINNGKLYITDLGSANGTWINEQKISPYMERILNHRDVLIMGKLKLQVLINTSPSKTGNEG